MALPCAACHFATLRNMQISKSDNSWVPLPNPGYAPAYTTRTPPNHLELYTPFTISCCIQTIRCKFSNCVNNNRCDTYISSHIRYYYDSCYSALLQSVLLYCRILHTVYTVQVNHQLLNIYFSAKIHQLLS